MELYHLDYQSPELGYTWIAKVPREHWNIAFDLAAEVLRYIGAQKEDEKLALTFRYDSDKKRFAVIYGRKYISGFYLDKEDTLLRFYIDPAFDIQSEQALKGSDFEFADQTQLVYCRIEDYPKLSEEFKKRSLDASREYAVSATKSPYKRNHRPWVWEVIFNPEAREEFLTYVESSPEERIKTIYRGFLNAQKNDDEIYKWNLLEKFQKVWDLQAEDFAEVLSKIKFGNLISSQANSFFNLARKHPEEAREYFKLCLDKSLSIEERIQRCKAQSLELLKIWKPKWTTTGQDERTLSVLWAFDDISTHIPYKSSFYSRFASFNGIKTKKAGQRYGHYLSLCQDFVVERIASDRDLIEAHNATLPAQLVQLDPAHHLLMQNMLYVVFDQIWEEEKENKSEEIEGNETPQPEAENETNMKATNAPLNQILYGPPGTGKTYRLKNEHFEKYTTRETSVSPEQHFEDVAADLSWWQVSALALLELKDAKVADIKQNRWVQHKVGYSASKNLNATIWGTLQTHALEESETVSYKQRQPPLIFDKSDGSRWRILEDQVKEQAPELLEILDSVNNFKPNPDKSIERFVFTTFHQSYSYEDFLEGIKPVMEDESDGNIAYRIEPGIFKKLCDRAAKDPDHRYAIFIDEINRGNIANIFGELITLIEPDKRTGGDNPMSATLPYSKTKFSVPSNVDIYGTMNTADRSVEALDTALRRRFSFREMMPQPELIDDKLGEKATWKGISLSEVLKTINDRIEVLVDRDHAIGHSYFLCLQDEENFDEALKAVFTDKIIPLLQEYFYNDYVKIGMVLGSGFVKTEKEAVKFAEFEDTLAGDYENGVRMKLIPPDEMELEKALMLLLNTEKPESTNAEG